MVSRLLLTIEFSTFVGLGVMLALFPLPGYLAKLAAHYQKETLKRTDARVEVVTEGVSPLPSSSCRD